MPFRFLSNNNPKGNEWTGATWFWEGANFDGALHVDRSSPNWRITSLRCEHGLLEFLQSFPENMIIPIKSIFYNNRFYGADENGGQPMFFPEMLTDSIVVIYYVFF